MFPPSEQYCKTRNCLSPHVRSDCVQPVFLVHDSDGASMDKAGNVRDDEALRGESTRGGASATQEGRSSRGKINLIIRVLSNANKRELPTTNCEVLIEVSGRNNMSIFSYTKHCIHFHQNLVMSGCWRIPYTANKHQSCPNAQNNKAHKTLSTMNVLVR